MKFAAVIAIAVSAVAVAAQSLSDFPTCAQSCLLTGVEQTTCGLLDFKCSCSNSAFINSSTTCIQGACSAADTAKARAAAIALCAANGVTITLPGGMSATTTSAASSPSTTTAAPPSGPTIATPATGPTTTTAATAVPTSAATSAVPVPTGGSPCRPQYQPRRNINL